MRTLSLFPLLLALTFSCTKPVVPDAQEKDDEQETVQPSYPDTGNGSGDGSDESSMKISITTGGRTITATLVKNAATDKLKEILSRDPLRYASSDNGFETYGDVGQALPTSNESITAASGDILLYASRYVCIFWGANAYSYTRLGHIDGMSSSEIKEMFGGEVMIELRMANQ